MYNTASLLCQRSLGGSAVESSLDVGWRSVLLEQLQWTPKPQHSESHPTPDTRVMVALQGHQHVEVMKNGRWHGAELSPGAIGMTPGEQSDRLRWWGEVPFGVAVLYLPHGIIEAAAEQLHHAGHRTSEKLLSRLEFADAAVTGVVGSLLTGMRSGAPDLYAEQTAHWLAMHLLVTHGHSEPHGASSQGVRLTDQRLEGVIELMRSHYADALSLDALASEACISKFHFSRLFRERTGLSPHEFLVAERMNAARQLLTNTDLPISDVARQTGYRTTVQFGVAFKNANSMTATAFRKQQWRSPRDGEQQPTDEGSELSLHRFVAG